MLGHMCGPPYATDDYGAVWVCKSCGRSWHLNVRFKNGSVPIGPGRWERMLDSQAPGWARDDGRAVREMRRRDVS